MKGDSIEHILVEQSDIRYKPILIHNDKIYHLYEFKYEQELEEYIVKYQKEIFGRNTIYIDVKTKLKIPGLKSNVTDGFLIDFNDPSSFKIWLVEAELIKHDIEKHINPQVTNFIEKLRDRHVRYDIAEAIYSELSKSGKVRSLKKVLGDEMFKKLIDTLSKSKDNMIIIIDKVNLDLLKAYIDFYNKISKNIRIMILQLYRSNDGDEIVLVTPYIGGRKISKGASESILESKLKNYIRGIRQLLKKYKCEVKYRRRKGKRLIYSYHMGKPILLIQKAKMDVKIRLNGDYVDKEILSILEGKSFERKKKSMLDAKIDYLISSKMFSLDDLDRILEMLIRNVEKASKEAKPPTSTTSS